MMLVVKLNLCIMLTSIVLRLKKIILTKVNNRTSFFLRQTDQQGDTSIPHHQRVCWLIKHIFLLNKINICNTKLNDLSVVMLYLLLLPVYTLNEKQLSPFAEFYHCDRFLYNTVNRVRIYTTQT